MKLRFFSRLCLPSAVLLIFSLALLPACKRTERTEETTADITAAQMEARNEARQFVNYNWKDTMELQKRLLEVRSKQSKYIEAKCPEAAAAFDSTFISTLTTVRPDIAHHIK